MVVDDPQTAAVLAGYGEGDLTDADRRGPLRADSAAYVIYTSGSTGRPKGALFRDRHIDAIARIDTGLAWGDPATPPTPMLAATQMAHVGFTTKLAWYLRTGTTTLLLARWRASDQVIWSRHRRRPMGTARARHVG